MNQKDEYLTRDTWSLQPVKPDCSCETCRPITLTDMRMVLCETCGNKRCPHATDHRSACTNSNEVGQKGSSWEHVKPPETERDTKTIDMFAEQAS